MGITSSPSSRRTAGLGLALSAFIVFFSLMSLPTPVLAQEAPPSVALSTEQADDVLASDASADQPSPPVVLVLPAPFKVKFQVTSNEVPDKDNPNAGIDFGIIVGGLMLSLLVVGILLLLVRRNPSDDSDDSSSNDDGTDESPDLYHDPWGDGGDSDWMPGA